jgi:hypothetical protein
VIHSLAISLVTHERMARREPALLAVGAKNRAAPSHPVEGDESHGYRKESDHVVAFGEGGAARDGVGVQPLSGDTSGLICMGARHRRQAGVYTGRNSQLGTPRVSDDTVGVAVADEPRLRRAGRRTHQRVSRSLPAGDDTADVAVTTETRRRRAARKASWRASNVPDLDVPDQSAVAAYDWIWVHGWHLDRRKGERLAYYMKTRYITLALVSVGFRMMNVISSPVMLVIVFMLTVAAGAMNWIAEYLKHQIGTQGLSITLGIRWKRWFITPWLDASPRK